MKFEQVGWISEYDAESGEHLTHIKYGNIERECPFPENAKYCQSFAEAKKIAIQDYLQQIESLKYHLKGIRKLKEKDFNLPKKVWL